MTTISDPATTYRGFPTHELIDDYRLAVVSRYLDDREIALQKQSRVFFQISGAGHEALLLALARSLRAGYDWFFPYYRDRSLVLGLGVTPTDILLQAVGSSADPASGGRQMPCHWGSADRNIVTQSSATASQCLSAVGCAEATRYIQGRDLPGATAHGDELTYVSLGEGSTSEGEFWESLNTSCRLHLPILYLVADNGYAISVRAEDQSPAPISEMVRGFRGLAVTQVDGRDYFQSRHVGARAIARVRAGEGPGLIHAKVTRPYSHSAADTQSKYRSAGELEEELRHDPITQFGDELVAGGVLAEDDLERIREEAKATVAEAARAALAAPRPDPSTVLEHVYVVPDILDPGPAPVAAAADADADDKAAAPVALGEAIRRTLFELMEADERIRVFGEDVADAPEEWIEQVEGKGGVFGTTHGLQRMFGVARCYNTPLAEANIIGRGVGQAIRGLRPCPEIQFFDYIWPAMTQIKTEAATIRWRSNGAFRAPVVIRVPIGGYLRGGAIWHSQSGESIFAHIPGLIVMFPARARDAAGMLRCAFRCDDPVLFLEHKHLLRQPYTRDPFPPPEWVVPLGRGDLRQEGTDLTVVSWGATVQKSIDAAAQLQERGYATEVIDLRFISPWDQEIVGESVAKTGKVLVVHEDIRFIGFGAEVAAWIAEECFTDLDAPIGRVGAKTSHVAYEPTLEEAILPQVHDITAAALELLKF